MRMALILITLLAALLAVSCSAEIGNDGGGNSDNDTYDIRLDYDADGDNDSDDKLAQCTSCVTDLAESLECKCLSKYDCAEEDLDQAYAGAVIACEEPIALGEEVFDSGIGEGAL